MKTIDPLTLQRLTDGELSIDQIKQVVNDAQSHPEQWPTIAKALIEDKLWQNQIPAAIQLPTSVERETEVIPKSSQNRLSWTPWLSIAAALMVATVGGYLAASYNTGADPSSINANLLTNSNPVSPITPANFTPDYHLKFSKNSNLARHGFSPSGEVPLYSINNADELEQFQNQQAFKPISRELLKKLTSAGYRINNDIELISGDFDDQNKFVVPVRTIRLEPSQ